jgi:hypothetical protein
MHFMSLMLSVCACCCFHACNPLVNDQEQRSKRQCVPECSSEGLANVKDAMFIFGVQHGNFDTNTDTYDTTAR